MCYVLTAIHGRDLKVLNGAIKFGKLCIHTIEVVMG